MATADIAGLAAHCALLSGLDDRENDRYRSYARLADHPVERVEIPFTGSCLPAWFHLPHGYVLPSGRVERRPHPKQARA